VQADPGPRAERKRKYEGLSPYDDGYYSSEEGAELNHCLNCCLLIAVVC
jgi:hypothetical protein